VLFGLGYVWRISGRLQMPPITDHLSNVYLTGFALVLLSGRSAFVDPSRIGRAGMAAGALLILNFVAEIVLAWGNIDEVLNRLAGNVNTSDPVDGLFGMGTVVVVTALLPWRGGTPPPAASAER
jgi:hypothetical protein